MTLDADPECQPDHCQRAEDPWPLCGVNKWDAILLDRPYTPEDAAKYRVDLPLPDMRKLLKRAWEVLGPGRRMGILDYIVPSPPTKDTRLVAVVGVLAGFNNRMRAYTVFEKHHPGIAAPNGCRQRPEPSPAEVAG